MKKIRLLYPVSLLAAAVAFGWINQVQAVVPPSIEGGDFYRVKNLTKGSAFANSTSADKCDELQYRIQIHNPGPDEPLTNVVVKASIPGPASTQNVSTATISASNAVPTSVSDTATVNISTAQKVTYVPGSSQLLAGNGTFLSTIGDVTNGSGVNIGNVGISINQQRFVQFKAKVDCLQPPHPEKKFDCTSLTVVKLDRTKFKFTATASVQNVTIQNYVFTARNAANSTVDSKTVTTSAASADYEFNQSTAGTYTVSAVINTDSGATNPAKCTKQVTVEKEGENPPSPPPEAPPSTPPSGGGQGGGAPAPPESGVLPATGPTDMAAIFISVTLSSYAAYYVYQRKMNI